MMFKRLERLKNKLFYRLARCLLGNKIRVWVLRHSNCGYIGKGVYIGEFILITRTFRNEDVLYIGDRVSIAPNVTIVTSSGPHGSDFLRRYYQPKHEKVFIENGAWISTGAIILPGVRIGKDAIVAAGAVVITDVPPFTLVAGVPAKVIKKLELKK